MARLGSALAPPPPGGDPRDIIRYVRRVEVVTGIGCIVAAAVWNDLDWLRWVLVATGVFSLSPWPGAAAILRRAERDPGVLVADPERRRARGRRVVLILAPLETVIGFAVGYVLGGWTVAVIMGPLIGVGAFAGAWLYLRWAR